MNEKNVDLDGTLYDLTSRYPELIEILFGLGFAGVKNPAMRESHGRQMTLRAGCAHMGLELSRVAAALRAAGFSVKE
jgi:hypothetical protein